MFPSSSYALPADTTDLAGQYTPLPCFLSVAVISAREIYDGSGRIPIAVVVADQIDNQK